MTAHTLTQLGQPAGESPEELLEQAFTRVAGAEAVADNGLRLLRDAEENYPAWLDAIAGAERYVYFESYILYDDKAGRRFADALLAKARDGVRVRLVYDWMGAIGKTSKRFWRELSNAGIEVRSFNPFRIGRPLGWVHRDHRKTLSVDGHIAFVSGLCVGDAWVGDPERGIDPWRDTGVEVRGPGAVDVERGFARVWAQTGPRIPDGERASRNDIPRAGDFTLRVVGDEPWGTGIFRLDQLVAAAARETLWLTDAYFAGSPTYVQALRSAARDGVDVRLLVPGGTDIPILRPLSRAGYRPLLEAGVRVFEWKGPMLHAKTAVADGHWSRVGSSNLNVASWLGNYEMDVVTEDPRFAAAMEQMYLDDLSNATEIVLDADGGAARTLGSAMSDSRSSARRGAPSEERPAAAHGGGSAGRAAAGAIRLGNAVSAVLTDRRVFTPVEAPIAAAAGFVLVALAIVAALWPQAVAIPFAFLALWAGVILLARAMLLSRRRRTGGDASSRVVARPREATEAASAASGRRES
jgi:cardiolipin synthase